jgi:hypothetical protein
MHLGEAGRVLATEAGDEEVNYANVTNKKALSFYRLPCVSAPWRAIAPVERKSHAKTLRRQVAATKRADPQITGQANSSSY